MRFVGQQMGPTCAAVALATILDVSELEAIELCGTSPFKGTSVENLREAFYKRGYPNHLIQVKTRLGRLWWLPALSSHFPIVALTNDHAFTIADKMIYDAVLQSTMPIEYYRDRHLHSVLVIDKEIIHYGSSRL